MMRYYIADCHFYHANINHQMDCRGFADVEEMNAYMIEKWNKKVRWNDEVIILGDLSFGTAEESTALLEQLNGHLCLIQGNHDRYGTKKGYGTSRFKWIRPYTELRDNRRKVILCHYPLLCYNGQYKLMEDGTPQTYMLYGHVHDTVDQRLIEDFQEKIRSTVRYDRSGHPFHIPCNLINCFCMFSDYTPLTLDEWIECDRLRLEKRKQTQ